ncbi:MAG: zf-HC2 domain-containing protein [Gemmatimonadaceae bacterium]
MTPHPEEGTLHAYIDGELARVEAATLELHVAECARCAAALAEARGLVAAASRAISALDAAPSSAAAAGSPAITSAPAAPRRAARPPIFRVPYARAAALLLLAGGTAVVINRLATSEAEIRPRAESAMAGAASMDERTASVVPTVRTTAAQSANRAPTAAGRDLSARGAVGGAASAAQKSAAPPPSPRLEQRPEAIVLSGAAAPATRVTRFRTKDGIVLTLTEEPLRTSFAEETNVARPAAGRIAPQAAAAQMSAAVVNSYRWSSGEQGRAYTLTGPLGITELEAASKRLSELERLP